MQLKIVSNNHKTAKLPKNESVGRQLLVVMSNKDKVVSPHILGLSESHQFNRTKLFLILKLVNTVIRENFVVLNNVTLYHSFHFFDGPGVNQAVLQPAL